MKTMGVALCALILLPSESFAETQFCTDYIDGEDVAWNCPEDTRCGRVWRDERTQAIRFPCEEMPEPPPTRTCRRRDDSGQVSERWECPEDMECGTEVDECVEPTPMQWCRCGSDDGQICYTVANRGESCSDTCSGFQHDMGGRPIEREPADGTDLCERSMFSTGAPGYREVDPGTSTDISFGGEVVGEIDFGGAHDSTVVSARFGSIYWGVGSVDPDVVFDHRYGDGYPGIDTRTNDDDETRHICYVVPFDITVGGSNDRSGSNGVGISRISITIGTSQGGSFSYSVPSFLVDYILASFHLELCLADDRVYSPNDIRALVDARMRELLEEAARIGGAYYLLDQQDWFDEDALWGTPEEQAEEQDRIIGRIEEMIESEELDAHDAEELADEVGKMAEEQATTLWDLMMLFELPGGDGSTH